MWRRISFFRSDRRAGAALWNWNFADSGSAVCPDDSSGGCLADGFYRNLVVGFSILYLFQTFLTVGGGSKFIPLTGVTLPLVSYGGSSVMTTILMFGVIEGVFVLRYDEELRIEKQRRKKKRQTEETE